MHYGTVHCGWPGALRYSAPRVPLRFTVHSRTVDCTLERDYGLVPRHKLLQLLRTPTTVLYSTVHSCTVRYCTLQYCTLLYIPVQCGTVHYCTPTAVLYCAIGHRCTCDPRDSRVGDNLYNLVLKCPVLGRILQFCIVLFFAVVCCPLQYCKILFNTLQYLTVPSCALLYSRVPPSLVLYCTIQYCAVQYSVHSTILHLTLQY